MPVKGSNLGELEGYWGHNGGKWTLMMVEVLENCMLETQL